MSNNVVTSIPNNNPESKKTKILIALTTFFICATIVFVSLFAWRSCNSATTYKVAIDSNTLTINKTDAKSGEDFNAKISIKEGKTGDLPLKNDLSVKYASSSTDVPFTYSDEDGTFYIASKDITANIVIKGEAKQR